MENKENMVTTEEIICDECQTKNGKENKFCFNCGNELKKEIKVEIEENKNVQQSDDLIEQNVVKKNWFKILSYVILYLMIMWTWLMAGISMFVLVIYSILFLVLSYTNNKKLRDKELAKKNDGFLNSGMFQTILGLIVSIMMAYNCVVNSNDWFQTLFILIIIVILYFRFLFVREIFNFLFEIIGKAAVIFSVFGLILLGPCFFPLVFS